MTDADWLRTVQREKTPDEVHKAERARDRQRGEYIPHHHRTYYGESRH